MVRIPQTSSGQIMIGFPLSHCPELGPIQRSQYTQKTLEERSGVFRQRGKAVRGLLRLAAVAEAGLSQGEAGAATCGPHWPLLAAGRGLTLARQMPLTQDMAL